MIKKYLKIKLFEKVVSRRDVVEKVMSFSLSITNSDCCLKFEYLSICKVVYNTEYILNKEFDLAKSKLFNDDRKQQNAKIVLMRFLLHI